MRGLNPHRLRVLRAANYGEAGGTDREPPNAKRRTFAGNFVALLQDYGRLSIQLGHVSSQQSLQYVGLIDGKSASEYFEILPPSADLD